jgi:hypothetical protein
MDRAIEVAETDPDTPDSRLLQEQSEGEQFYLLQSAFCTEDLIDDTNWLTSTFIDLTLWNLARVYPSVYFLPTDFLHIHLESAYRRSKLPPQTRQEYRVQDILGRRLDYESKNPIVFVANVGKIHWNMFRVQLTPTPELQLFEPMG